MKKTEKVLRQFLRSSCDVNSTLEPDLKLVGENGATFAHKFVIFSFLPDLRRLLCDSCLESHCTTTMVFPDVSVQDLIEARDFLYMFGEKESFAKLFNMKKEVEIKQSTSGRTSRSADNKITQIKPSTSARTSRKTKNMITYKKEPNLSEKLSATKIRMKNFGEITIRPPKPKPSNGTEFDETNKKQKIDSITTDPIESNDNGKKLTLELDLVNKTDAPLFTEDKIEVDALTETPRSDKLNIIMADFEELVGEAIEMNDEVEALDFKENLEEEEEFLNDSIADSVRKIIDGAGNRLCCKECGKAFEQEKSLRNHVDMVHRGIRYPCDFCEYLGTQIKNVKRHIEFYHPECDNRYKNINIL